jgi:8-oxo-dGTP pyrophosphatase MutT (NUDIX family)
MQLVFLKKPEIFSPKFEVVSCFIRHEEDFLFLHRQDHKPEGNTWAMPAGKIDRGEDILEAMSRELYEEVGLKIEKGMMKKPLATYVKYPTKDFVYYITEVLLIEKPKILLNIDEHKGYEWITLDEALKRDLIPGEDECIRLYYNL